MPDVIPTTPVPMPSADLVTFRFDQLDKEMVLLHTKMDGLTTNFTPIERTINIERQLDNYRWYLRAMVTAVLVALATAVGSLVMKLQ